MSRYLIAIHRPSDYDPSTEDAAMGRAIDALNREMVAAGIRVFVGGLHPIRSAQSLELRPDGDVVRRDGPYLTGAEHVDGFWVLDVATLDEALAWGRRAALACRASVEVRAFH